MKARIFVCILLLFSISVSAQENNAPVVENVQFEQRTDGSLLVDIYYDVTDIDGDTLQITVEASSDDGITWGLPCDSLSGDIGDEILSGTDKHIIWHFYADNPDTKDNDYRVRIIAYDKKLQTGTMTDQDGNVYKTVKIGDQWWMAENLKVKHYRNGDSIPNVSDGTEWINLSTGAYCALLNNESNADIYGYLYNWYAVNDSRNIFPEGWHVPTDEEWKKLEMFLGMSKSEADDNFWRGTNEGSRLAGNASLWPDGDLKNNTTFGISGFSALPGGSRYYGTGYFSDIGDRAYFWSNTEISTSHCWGRDLRFSTSKVWRVWNSKLYGFSVRLVRD